MTARQAPRMLADLPLVLTIDEAAVVLGIGRSTAYAEARRYLATEGREGLPARRIGRLLRVPRPLLCQFLGEPTTEKEETPLAGGAPEMQEDYDEDRYGKSSTPK